MKTSFVPRIMQRALLAATSLAFVALTACSGGGGGGSTTPPTPTGPQVAKLSVVTIADANSTQPKNSVKTDNSDRVTVAVTALDANNVAVKDAVVSFSSAGGELQAAASVTDAQGKITAQFSAGISAESKVNHTETITVTSGNGITSLVPIDVTGTTVTAKLAPGSSSSVATGATVNISVVLKDAGGNPINGVPVSVSSTGSGSVGAGSAVSTDKNGEALLPVVGQSVGATTLITSAAGASASLDLTVTPGTGGVSFAEPANNSLLAVAEERNVRVSVPTTTTKVVLATTLGTWKANGKNTITIDAVGGVANATFSSANAGVATVDAYDLSAPSSRATLTLNIGTSNTTGSVVTLQASPAAVAVSSDQKKNSITLSARVVDPSNNPVINAPVSFRLETSTSSGEVVGPTVAFTNAAGVATSSFTSGTQPGKVIVKAGIVDGVGVTEGSATIDVGGQAATIGLAQDTKLQVKDNDPNYYLAMSAYVVDIKGNPVPGATVTLSVNPIYFSTGISCSVTGTYTTEWPEEEPFLVSQGLSLSRAGVWRGISFGGATKTADRSDAFPTTLQPTNGNAGTVPAEVVTGADGKVNFTYSYPKSSAFWHVVRVSARTFVAGTEARTNYIFRLAAVKEDVAPNCAIADSPYNAAL
ncbi:Ig-like domain-containing protein [Chitinivorax sp. B]|uniref:Ig-like domain-containing protein n=1 Tax=Chitinivorax sp. B TaxID=2502235 RepID=UPI0010F4A7FD|nr:Ig-like domain-containing protein [Chitinivorax sp. B]